MLRSTRSRVVAAVFGGLIVAAPLAVAAAPLHGAPSPEAVREHVEARLGDLLDEIDATPAQREHLEGVVREGFREAAALHRDLGELHGRFRAALHDGDADGVETARQDLVRLVDRKSKLVTKGLLEVRHTLSDEQWSTVEAEHDALLDRVERHGWR